MAEVAASLATIFVAGAVGLSIASFAAILTRGQYHRYGRSVDGNSEALERTMALIKKEDLTGCGMRLVCELGAVPPYLLDARETAILDLVGTIPPGYDLRTAGQSALTQYRLSRAFGQGGGDCHGAFPLCPFNRTELMTAVTGHAP